MCSFRWSLKQGVLGTIMRWNWYRRLEDERPTLQAMPGSPHSCSSSCPWHYRGGCGLISKQVHNQLSRCNPLFHFLNVLVPTGFVLVCQKQLYSRKIFKLGDETLQYKQELVVEGQRSRSRGRQIIQTVNASKQQMGTTPNFRVI